MKTKTMFTVYKCASKSLSTPMEAEKVQLFIDDIAKSRNIHLTYVEGGCAVEDANSTLVEIRAVKVPIFEPEKLMIKNIYQDKKEISK